MELNELCFYELAKVVKQRVYRLLNSAFKNVEVYQWKNMKLHQI